MLRDRILADIEQEWEAVAAQLNDDPVMGTPPSDITLFEHIAARVSEAHCEGDGVAIFTLTRDLRKIAPITDRQKALVTSYRKAYWEHAISRLHVSQDGSQGVLEIVFGPRYGRGYRYHVSQDGKIRKENTWIS